MDSAILYQPKEVKEYFLTNPRNHLITTRATMKETTKPNMRILNSEF